MTTVLRVNGIVKFLLTLATFQVLLDCTLVCVAARRRRVPRQQSLPPVLVETRGICGKVPRIQIHDAIKSQATVTPFGQVPWQVGIFYGQHNESFLCAGTLISRIHVLTAAICLVSVQSSEDLRLRLGDWDISDHDSNFEAYQAFHTTAKKVIILQGDEPMRPSLNAVALLTLSEAVDFDLYPQVRPICLPEVTSLQNETKNKKEEIVENCFTSGWGYQDPSVAEPPQNVTFKSKLDKHDEAVTYQSVDSVKSQEPLDKNVTDAVLPRSLSSSQEKPTSPILILVPLVLDEQEEKNYRMVDPVQEERIPNYFTANMPVSIDPVFNADLDLLPLTNHDSWELAPYTAVTNADGIPDENRETPAENSTQFHVLHRAMFRHKEKYKSGKDFLRRKFSLDAASIEESNPAIVKEDILLDKRNQGQKKYNVNTTLAQPTSTTGSPQALSAFPMPVPPQNVHKQSLSLLKAASVSLQRSCAAIPEVEKGEATVGKACIVPINPEYHSLCMVNLGSPVTCKGQRMLRRTRSIAAGSSMQEVQDKNALVYDDSRSVLVGIVTWKRPCFVDDSDPALQKYNFVAETKDFLTLLLEKLKSS